jgi:hypothetical protein
MRLFIKIHAFFYYTLRSLLSHVERLATCDHLADAIREHTKALREQQ